MNEEIKSIFVNTLGTISYLIVIFFFVTLIMFIHNDVNDALKEAWVASIYFLSVLATLGAAFIASKLFNDWRVQEIYNRTKDLHDEAVEVLLKTTKKLNSILGQIEINRLRFNEQTLTIEQVNEIEIAFSNHVKDVVIDVQELTHNIGVKIALDYSKSITNNDDELSFVFNILMEIKSFVQQIAHEHGINKDNIKNVQVFINSLNTRIDIKLQTRNQI
ncbi:hypothetical protein [Acinetobacter guillouiae]|uniref:hypothetical protein n=1 Tax=Acinetobacter guillouiae TaxID=106649 RepID=UPI001A548567|nr:hypothetical protein [Acinetobacter sp.]